MSSEKLDQKPPFSESLIGPEEDIEGEGYVHHALLPARKVELAGVKRLDQLFGIENVKKQLAMVAFSLCHPKKVEVWGGQTSTGMIMEGSPGNGQTTIARAFAKELNAGSLYEVNLTNAWDEGVAAIKEDLTMILEECEQQEDGIAVIVLDGNDSIDEISPPLAQILETMMEWIKDEARGKIYPILMTNGDEVDEDIRSLFGHSFNRVASRFDTVVVLDDPDDQERSELISDIVALTIGKRGSKKSNRPFEEDLDVQAVVEATQGMNRKAIIMGMQRVGMQHAFNNRDRSPGKVRLITTDDISDIFDQES